MHCIMVVVVQIYTLQYNTIQDRIYICELRVSSRLSCYVVVNAQPCHRGGYLHILYHTTANLGIVRRGEGGRDNHGADDDDDDNAIIRDEMK